MYKVFISHSTRDKGLVAALAHLFKELELTPVVARWYLTPNAPLDKKVFGLIDGSDCIVVLLTKNGMRSNWVRQEIGYSIKQNKNIIPIVERGTLKRDLDALKGREHILYDAQRPDAALQTASTYIKHLHLKKKEQEKAIVVIGGIAAFLYLLSQMGGDNK
ncbi:MAG: toll/interleukin-1 receptor domain-containing protein [Deltaproteobacteria bacterium]|nr:toll/interleukin-1 receptor domain-containing protein [Deltaproteobacteria bacterium]